MISKKQQKEMLDYLVARLEPCYSQAEPRQEALSGIEVTYIRVDDGLVLLADRDFPREKIPGSYGQRGRLGRTGLEKVLRAKQQETRNIAVIMYKDNDRYFKTAAPKEFNKIFGKSLTGYSAEDIEKMIWFSPVEVFLNNERSHLQYYQPESERLKQGIILVKYKPVTSTYGHIAKENMFLPHEQQRFVPQPRERVRAHIWTYKGYTDKNLKVKNGLLVPNDS